MSAQVDVIDTNQHILPSAGNHEPMAKVPHSCVRVAIASPQPRRPNLLKLPADELEFEIFQQLNSRVNAPMNRNCFIPSSFLTHEVETLKKLNNPPDPKLDAGKKIRRTPSPEAIELGKMHLDPYPTKVYLYICEGWGERDSLPKTRSPKLRLLPNRILTPEEANKSCANYDPATLLEMLNELTGYELLMDEPNLQSGLTQLINGQHDFGRAYAWFRTAFIILEKELGYRGPPPNKPIEIPNSPGQAKWLLRLTRNELIAIGFNDEDWLLGEKDDDEALIPLTERRLNLFLRLWSAVQPEVRKCVPLYAGLPCLQHCDLSLTTSETPEFEALDRRTTVIQEEDGASTILHPGKSHPRRLWDLIANRVVPYDWHARISRHRRAIYFPNETPLEAPELDYGDSVNFAAISHSWVRDLKMQISPVNAKQWPIPLPAGVTIESIRHQVLNELRNSLRASCPEYCWLDIVCLRQAWRQGNGKLLVDQRPLDIDGCPLHYPMLEERRHQEWEIDVPTIGGIYRRARKILVYLNGVGIPISSAAHLWQGAHHWTNRAWTLQEWVKQDGELPALMGSMDMDDRSILLECLQVLEVPVFDELVIQNGKDFRRLISIIIHRHCSNEADQVAGMLHFLTSDALPVYPVYAANETVEQAWGRLIHTLTNPWKWELVFNLPQPLNQLFPSWKELKRLDRKRALSDNPTLKEGDVVPSEVVYADALLGPIAFQCRVNLSENQKSAYIRKWTPASFTFLPTNSTSCGGGGPSNTRFITSGEISFSRFQDGGEYYMIPQLGMKKSSPTHPGQYLWIGRGGSEVRTVPSLNFLLCIPLCVNNSEWDGLSFKRIGSARIRFPSYQYNRSSLLHGTFVEVFNKTYEQIPWQEILDDTTRMSVRQMRSTYGFQNVYSLIFRGEHCK